MAKKTAPKRRKATGPRASWKGMLRLSLVAVPVQAFNAAAKKEEIHLHQLHAACHRRIRYQKICPVHGEVAKEEIVLGYEDSKGRYVEIREAELETLRTDKDRHLAIDRFVEPAAIDPIYFDGRVYYLVPDGESGRGPYAVLKAAMERKNLYGIGQIVFSGREQLVLLRPLDGLLAMLMLSYQNQVRTPELFQDQLPKQAPPAKEVEMAEKLIEATTDGEFDFAQYEDPYLKKLRQLIEAKIEGEELVVSKEVAEEPEVINLMDALKKSVARAAGTGETATNGRAKAGRKSSSPKKSGRKGKRRAS